MFKCSLVQLLQPCIFFLPLRLILLDLLLIGRNRCKHFPLALQELLLLPIQLGGLRDDILLLLRETLINGSLLTFLLQKAHRLKWTLTLNDKGPDTRQIFICDLGLRVLAQILIDSIE